MRASETSDAPPTIRARAVLARLATLCALLALSLSACTGPGDFHCTANAQCGQGGAFCEPEGRCSFAVAPKVCSSGRRYGEAAGPRSGQCVAPDCKAAPPTALAAGDRHACLLREGGAVACWGANDRGQIGDGSLVPRAAPVDVVLPGAVVEVVTGSAHGCALRSTGLVYCWGANEHGQLGDGSQADQRTPVSVRLGTSATHLAAGADFTCASLADGDVTCWGANDSGQCGIATPGAIVLTPVGTLGLTRTKGLAAGHHHACAFSEEGRLLCWGNDTVGQIGDGSTSSFRAPTVVNALGDARVSGVTAGDGHTCALADGRLFCWGSNSAGQLGLGTDADGPSPTELTAFHDALAVSAGSQHTCARRANGSLWCWGGNNAGQLGDGTTSSLTLPVPVAGAPEASALASGGDFTCMLGVDKNLACWGSNREGELAVGNRLFDASAALVSGLSAVKALAVGRAHACAITGDERQPGGEVRCWGANQAGQLGAGDLVDRTSPLATKVPLVAASLAAGATHTCAVLQSNGGVSCWGRGSDGQLGNGNMIDARVPVAAKDGTPATAVATGAAHTCALHGDGTVSCWGRGDRGQLGDGGKASRATPAVVPDLAATALVAGDAHTCALGSAGEVSCWGRGSEGQLGRGSNADEPRPAAVALGKTVALAAGAFHTCALGDDGQVRCWGDGSRGQLGDPRRTLVNAPWLVPDLDHVVALAAGRAHTCVQLGAGSHAGPAGGVLCWGDGARGQTGSDPLTTGGAGTATATLLPSAGDITTLSLGGDETCFVTADGLAHCLGDDESGQLGRGGELQFPTPQPSRLCP